MYCRGASAVSWLWRSRQARDNAFAARQCSASKQTFLGSCRNHHVSRGTHLRRQQAPELAACNVGAPGVAAQHVSMQRGGGALQQGGSKWLLGGSSCQTHNASRALLPAHRRPEVHKAVVADLHAAGAWALPLLLPIAVSLLSLLQALHPVLLPPRLCIKPLVEPVILENSWACVGLVTGELRRQVPVLRGAQQLGKAEWAGLETYQSEICPAWHAKGAILCLFGLPCSTRAAPPVRQLLRWAPRSTPAAAPVAAGAADAAATRLGSWPSACARMGRCLHAACWA